MITIIDVIFAQYYLRAVINTVLRDYTENKVTKQVIVIATPMNQFTCLIHTATPNNSVFPELYVVMATCMQRSRHQSCDPNTCISGKEMMYPQADFTEICS